MEMGAARYSPMDAQRFDPLRRTNMVSIPFDFITLRFLNIIVRLRSIFSETHLAFQNRQFKFDDEAGPLHQDRENERE